MQSLGTFAGLGHLDFWLGWVGPDSPLKVGDGVWI